MLLLHGFGGDLNNWLFAAPALAEGHTVYALELPGHGGSSKDVGPGDLDFLVDAVQQFLDSLDLQRVHLVGHSLGGLVAASVALRDPGRGRSLHARRQRGPRRGDQRRLPRRVHLGRQQA